MGCDFHLEYADVLIFQGEMMAGLGGDFDLRRRLGSESKSEQQDGAKSETIAHEARF